MTWSAAAANPSTRAGRSRHVLKLLFPAQIDNRTGSWLSVLLLIPIVIVKLGISAGGTFSPLFVISGPDGVAFDSFGPAGQQAFLSAFMALGWGLMLQALLAAIVLLRYRAMVPLMYLYLTIENAGRTIIGRLVPIPRNSGDYIGLDVNAALLVALLVGLALALSAPTRQDT
jgi:hypothetical protein